MLLPFSVYLFFVKVIDKKLNKDKIFICSRNHSKISNDHPFYYNLFIYAVCVQLILKKAIQKCLFICKNKMKFCTYLQITKYENKPMKVRAHYVNKRQVFCLIFFPIKNYIKRLAELNNLCSILFFIYFLNNIVSGFDQVSVSI